MDKEHPRFVSLVPSWTETLYHFGFDAEVVGVTDWCVHPKELVARVQKVGGTKNPDVERIVQLAPDLVIANHEENRREDVEALQKAGLDVWVSDVRTIADSIRESRRLGELTGRREAGKALALRIEQSARDVEGKRGAPIDVYVPIWRRPWMTLTEDTYAHDVLALAGARNVFADASEGRYPERDPEEAIEAGATAVLLPSEPYPFAEKHVDELVEAGFPRERVVLVDGEALTWYGAREVEGLRVVGRVLRSLAPSA